MKIETRWSVAFILSVMVISGFAVWRGQVSPDAYYIGVIVSLAACFMMEMLQSIEIKHETKIETEIKESEKNESTTDSVTNG